MGDVPNVRIQLSRCFQWHFGWGNIAFVNVGRKGFAAIEMMKAWINFIYR